MWNELELRNRLVCESGTTELLHKCTVENGRRSRAVGSSSQGVVF